MTWGELKLNCLLEMGDATSLESADAETVSRMPHMANAGLQRLATVGRYIKRYVELAQNPMQLENLLGLEDMLAIRQVTSEDLSFTADGARAFYFECDNPCSVEVYAAGTLETALTNDERGRFTAHKGLITGTGTVELRFKAQYPYSVRNVCLYAVPFETAQDVPPFVADRIYDLKSFAPDIYAVDAGSVVFQGGEETAWTRTKNFELLPDNKLRLNAFVSGSWRIPYFAYPQIITKDTPDSETVSCDPEGLALLIYYICYHLYKGDDLTLATQWHNDFEEGLSASRSERSTAAVVVGGVDI